jgi:hypothetical protein
MSKTKFGAMLFCILVCALSVGGTGFGDTPGKEDYLADCARCHGVDGKGGTPGMRAVPGYRAVDLTQLRKRNNGKFPGQEVYDTIDGRKRFPAHYVGGMPTWGLKYRHDRLGPESEEKVKRRISALVDYVESLQEQ